MELIFDGHQLPVEKIINQMTLAAELALTSENVRLEDMEVSVTFVDMEEIRELNKLYRGQDKVTDVLSFPLGENGEYDINHDTGAKLLGDIVISVPKAVEQAEMYNHPLQREIGFLTVHSMLHLLGYDHENGGLEAVHMREKEETVLTQIGWKRNNSYYMGDE